MLIIVEDIYNKLYSFALKMTEELTCENGERYLQEEGRNMGHYFASKE